MPKKPWEIDGRLTLDRLLVIAQVLDGVRAGVADQIESGSGDRFFGGWVEGTMAHARSAWAIFNAAQSGTYPWLSILDKSMQFTFAIDGVPVRFFHGEAGDPSRSAVKGSPIEQQAQMLAFDLDKYTDERLEWGWRIAVGTDPDGRVYEMALVQVHRSGASRHAFSIPFKTEAVALAPVASIQPEAVELPSPEVEPLADIEATGTTPFANGRSGAGDDDGES